MDMVHLLPDCYPLLAVKKIDIFVSLNMRFIIYYILIFDDGCMVFVILTFDDLVVVILSPNLCYD